MDYPRESSAASAAGTVLIPTRFVWPYGGRSVYLSGSFTGWTEHFQMTPVEGCPTVFQSICSLPPGFYQYKFIVDGEWRHDERQPFVTGNYGTVNTVLLSRDSMEVDNVAFQRLVRVSDGTMHEAMPRISEADLEISRHRVSVFLSTHTAYELLPESGKVIALDVDLPVEQAFHILHEQGITIAPLWDFCQGKFTGVLSALDFILIMRELGDHGSNLTEEELETHTISAWKEAKLYLNRQTNEHRSEFPSQLVQAGPDENLKDVALKFLQNGVATVPIIHSSSEEGSFPQLLHLASLSEILKCISQVSSVPIVDDNDTLLDVYSRSDITSLAKDKVYTHINLQEMTIHQALQFGQEPYSPYGINSQRCHMCLRSDTLHKVMERLAKPGVRRLVIVDAVSRRVEGIISLSDIFRLLIG